MEIQISCKGADVLPLAELKDFQGDLKTITPENLDKLKRSIKKHGFTAPIFVWDNGGVKNILDGSQRMKALIGLQAEGVHVPDLPVVYIYADNEKDAKEKLLYITSQYGEFTNDGFFEFTDDLDFDFSDTRLTNIEFTAEAPDFEPATEDEQGRLDELEPKMVVCPHCGKEYDLREQD